MLPTNDKHVHVHGQTTDEEEEEEEEEGEEEEERLTDNRSKRTRIHENSSPRHKFVNFNVMGPGSISAPIQGHGQHGMH